MVLDTRVLVATALEVRTGMAIPYRRELAILAMLADPANLRRLAP